MSHQVGQSAERRSVRESSFESFKPRNLQAADQVGIERRRVHVSMVPAAPATTPHQNADGGATTDHHSAVVDLTVAIPLALSRAGLSHKQACAYMELDPSNWAKAIQGQAGMHVSLQRLLKLPIVFWREFLPMLAEPAGLAVSHEDMADIALKQTAVAVDALCRAVIQLQRRVG